MSTTIVHGAPEAFTATLLFPQTVSFAIPSGTYTDVLGHFTGINVPGGFITLTLTFPGGGVLQVSTAVGGVFDSDAPPPTSPNLVSILAALNAAAGTSISCVFTTPQSGGSYTQMTALYLTLTGGSGGGGGGGGGSTGNTGTDGSDLSHGFGPSGSVDAQSGCPDDQTFVHGFGRR